MSNKKKQKNTKQYRETHLDEQDKRNFWNIVFWPKETNHSTATKCWETRLKRKENLFDNNKEKKIAKLRTLLEWERWDEKREARTRNHIHKHQQGYADAEKSSRMNGNKEHG